MSQQLNFTKDNEKLVKTLRNLCDMGNTIIVVEHDEDTILASDWIVDFGFIKT